VHQKDPDRSRLNSFLQFWMQPLIWLTISIAFWWVLIDGHRKGYWSKKN